MGEIKSHESETNYHETGISKKIQAKEKIGVDTAKNFIKSLFQGIGEKNNENAKKNENKIDGIAEENIENKMSDNKTDLPSDAQVYSRLENMVKSLGKIEKELRHEKPDNAPNVEKWFENGGNITIYEKDGKIIWVYSTSDGKSAQYIDGVIKFCEEDKHPFIGDINIGKFTGDRKTDKEKAIQVLENQYGITEIPKGYDLHHDNENGVLQLVKSDIHKTFTHSGGHSMYREESKNADYKK